MISIKADDINAKADLIIKVAKTFNSFKRIHYCFEKIT